jgi:hypothetical protein
MGREASFRSGHAEVFDPKTDATYIGSTTLAGRTTSIRGNRLLASGELGEAVDMTWVGGVVVVRWLDAQAS